MPLSSSIFLQLLNYFWLSLDPRESASWYCDQHCFKIHTELISAVWDSVLTLAPWVEEYADSKNIPRSYRTRRHAKPGQKWHPLSKWTGICRGNAVTSMINARALLEEHQHRTGRRHVVWADWEFLWRVLPRVRYGPPPSTGEEAGKSAHQLFLSHHFSSTEIKNFRPFSPVPEVWFPLKVALSTKLFYTEPPRCFGKWEAPIRHTLVQAYRGYYEDKTLTMKQGMRYYHSPPPEWLEGDVLVRV